MLCTFRSLLSGLVILTAAVVWAAEPAPRPNPPVRDPYPQAANETDRTDRESTRTIRAGSLDDFMASCLRKGNQAEITLARLAQQRASDREVKAFAERMIKDHGDFLVKLENVNVSGPRANSTPEAGAATQPGNRIDIATAPRADTGATRANTAGGPATMEQFAQIGNEIAERCLASAQRELEQKDGADFDKCFMGMQLGAHMKMVDELTVFKKHASPEFHGVVTEGLEASQSHLEQAKKLMAHLETLPAASASRPADEIRK